MCVSKEQFRALETRIADLEKRVSDLAQSNEGLKQGMLMKICTNSVMKEQYNFELLKYLFKELGLKNPELKYDFGRAETFSSGNGERDQ